MPAVQTQDTVNTDRPERTRSDRTFRPDVDIFEKPDELVVCVGVPGVRPDDIDVGFENGILTLHGRVTPRQAPDTPFLLREYGVGDFYRTFQVSEMIDAARISAEYADGVLTLHLPKVEAVRPRKIAVAAASKP